MTYLVTSWIMIQALLGDYKHMQWQATNYGLYAFDVSYSDSLSLDNICNNPVNIRTLTDTNSIRIYCTTLTSSDFKK